MEALVVIVADLLGAALVSAALFAGGLLVAALLGGIELALGRRRATRPRLRAARRIALAAAAAVTFALLALQTVLVGPLTRAALSRVEASSGIAVTCARAEGNLLAGQLRIEGIALRRAAAPQLELQVAALEFDLDLRSLLAPRLVIESLSIRDVRGRIAGGGGGERGSPARPFTARGLTLAGVDLEVVAGDRTRRVTVDSLTIAPFRGDRPIHDLLFHAAGSAAVDGVSVTIRQEEGARGWSVSGLELAALGAAAGALADHLRGGRIGVDMKAVESPGELRFALSLAGARVAAGEDAKLRARAAAFALNSLLAAQDPLRLAFVVEIDPADYLGATSLEQVDLIAEVAAGLSRALRAQITGRGDAGERPRPRPSEAKARRARRRGPR